ncbi:MAG: DUF72 domain-containing protein, partial [Candidatus Eiseniibacteriota bacterium]
MILIGTSGYSFPDWVGPFYPEGTAKGKMLEFYVKHFPTVEVNATYYRIPPPSTLHAMEQKTPEGFQFVVKAHHDMTHKQSLDRELYASFGRAVDPLLMAGKLNGILAQFPYAFRRTAENEAFLVELKKVLPADAPLFVEFRHKSWIKDDVFPWMESQGLEFVSVDEPDLPGLVPPVARATGAVAYVRMHGRNKVNWWQPNSGMKEYAGPAASTRRIRPLDDFGPLFAKDAAGEVGPRPWSPGDRYDYLYSEAELKEWV